MAKMKHISILGSTGSIGTQTLEIVRKHPDKFKIVGLTANTNTELLIKHIALQTFQSLGHLVCFAVINNSATISII